MTEDLQVELNKIHLTGFKEGALKMVEILQKVYDVTGEETNWVEALKTAKIQFENMKPFEMAKQQNES